MKVENRPISAIEPYGKNAKKHPEKQIQQIADAIRNFGWGQPIVVDKDGVIIVGHGRYLAGHLLGMEIVPVLEMDLNEEQAKAYRLADNKLNESEWDMELAISELKELSVAMIDLTGFSRDLILESSAKDDKMPQDAPARATSGDLWLLGEHRVLCGDATDKEAVERLLDGKLADLVLTDPPYNMKYTGHAGTRRTEIANDDMGEGFEAFIVASLTHLVSGTKASAPFYMFTHKKETGTLRKAFEVVGLHPHQTIIWKKNSMTLSGSDYQHKYEPIVYGWRTQKDRYMVNDRTLTNVWDFDRPSSSQEHPTMKPVELLRYAIQNSSQLGDIVLDTFLGSGSTLIAAEKAGRVCYGMELEPKFVDVIVERWCQYTDNRTIKKNGEDIQW